MARNSDSPRRRRISATEASREFSKLLDKVASGSRFVVHRHGRDVCVMVPPEPQGRSISGCVALLRSRGRVELDDLFGRDLTDIVETEESEDARPWAS